MNPIEMNKTYMLRNGQRVYISSYWAGPDVMVGYGDDGIYHRFNRGDGTSWNYFFGGPSFNDPRLDIVGEAMDLYDLKNEYLSYEKHCNAQRAELERTRDLENGYELYRKWNRAHRPPGPLRPGLYEKDYDKEMVS